MEPVGEEADDFSEDRIIRLDGMLRDEENLDWLGEEMAEAVHQHDEDPAKTLENRIASLFGRAYGLGVTSATQGLLIALKALDIGPGSEVIVSPFSWYQIARAIAINGATPVFVDIDAWTFTIDPQKVEAAITEKTRAILAGNTLGHPADWARLRAIADRYGLLLIEDTTESLFSEFQGQVTGTFGDISIFQFGSPHPNRGESWGLVLTDDRENFQLFRSLRERKLSDRFSSIATCQMPLEAGIAPFHAVLALVSLKRLPLELQKKEMVLRKYVEAMRSFEGVKDLYRSPECGWVNSFLYMVHLGTRFSKSSRDAIISDLMAEGVEAAPYCQPLHLERYFIEKGCRKGMAPIAEKLAERAIALPLSSEIRDGDIERIANVIKDSSLNVGAGSAIY